VSTVAKVFIVLNLVFAVIYVGISAALLTKQENWYHKFKDLEAKKNKDNSEWTETRNRLNAQITTNNTALAALSAEVQRLGDDLKTMGDEKSNVNKQWEQSQTALGELKEQYNKLSVELQDQRQTNTTLESENDKIKAERDEAVRVREDTKDHNQRLDRDNKDLRQILDDLEKRHIELAKRNRENENIIANYLSKLKVSIPQALISAPAISGKVVGVSSQFNLVMLDVGENDQVRPGYEFTVYRGSTFVGRVKVDRVFPDMCACIAIEEYQKDEIRKGDEAATRVE